MEQDENLERIREYARTTVLNKEEDEEEVVPANRIDFTKQNSSSAPKAQNETAQVVSPLLTQSTVAQNSQVSLKRDEQKLNEIKEKIAKEQLRKQQEEQEKLKQEKTQEQEQEIEKDDQKTEEQKLDDLFADSLEIKETQDKQLEKQINENSSSKPKSYKFRFRLLGCVFACLVALSGGWIIGNVVDIVKTNAEIAEVAQSNSEYSANLAKLINKISKIKTGEQHPDDADKGSLLPIEEIIPITPEPLEDVTAYEQHSNWFDKICNWLKNLFGG